MRVVGEPAPDMIGVVFGLAEERGEVRIVHRVVDDGPVAARLDQSPIPQDAKLVRDRRLGDPDDEGQVAHA